MQVRKNRIIKYIVITIVLLVTGIFCWYENHHLVVSTYFCQYNSIPNNFDGYCIVQLSDFHNATFGQNNKKILDKVKELSPDIIVITGDFVDCNHTNVDISIDFAYALTKICSVYYIRGNHEWMLTESQKSELDDGLIKAGVKILNNEEEQIDSSNEKIRIIGLDDNSLQDGTLKKILGDDEAFNIVLAHEPQYINNYANAGADLVLTGHAHGGQFRIPGVGGLVAPEQGFFPQYTEGMHHRGNTDMIISRGLGNSIIPVRIMNDPEIVCVILKSE